MNREMLEQKEREDLEADLEAARKEKIKKSEELIHVTEDGYDVEIQCDNCLSVNEFCVRNGCRKNVIFDAKVKCKECKCELREYERGYD